MGRSKEDLTIYSLEEDLGRIIRDFTRHGITPPEAIGESATNTSFTVKTPEEIEAHNAQVREKLAQRASSDWESSTPKGKVFTLFGRAIARTTVSPAARTSE